MTRWQAIVPLRGHGERKTRLAAAFSRAERDALALHMMDHVLGVLASVTAIGEVAVLSSKRPPGWAGRLIDDMGRGLNGELDACAAACTLPLLIVHADLPLLAAADIGALLEAAAAGAALAPDRHGSGTNALAVLRAGEVRFAFGPESCRRHLDAWGHAARLVHRQGLALDIDTMDDMVAARTAGWQDP